MAKKRTNKNNADKITEQIDAMLAGSQDPKYDVNNDGKVNTDDLAELIDQSLNPVKPDYYEFMVGGVLFRMIPVEGGTFDMGAPNSELGSYTFEKPQHKVTLSDYKIGQTEVTQELWQAVMGNNPSHFKSNILLPVENISWNDCQAFITKLNEMTGKKFRLPTEAEWEYASRGGNKSQGFKYAGGNTIADVAWFGFNADYVSHPVATKLPNELGLYDMSGNVNEWCNDWYDRYPSDAQTDPQGGDGKYQYKVYRGGSYSSSAKDCRCAFRYMRETTFRAMSLGFRLAL